MPCCLPPVFSYFFSYTIPYCSVPFLILNSISPSVINKDFTFSLLNTDEEHQKALKDLEVARRNLQVFFTVLMMFLPHCKAYCNLNYNGSQDVFLFLCLQCETFNIVNIFLRISYDTFIIIFLALASFEAYHIFF